MASLSFIVLALVMFCTASVLSNPVHIANASMSMEFLNHFGYMSDSVMKMESGKKKAEKMEAAIMMYQEYNHINTTGELDNKTMSMMELPRCGNDDKAVVNQMVNPTRKKRYATNSKWDKGVITYKFTNYPRCCLTSDQIEQEFEEAVNIWMSVVAPSLIILKEVDASKPVDIDIEFVNGRHQDNISFASMNTIAHAFYPIQEGGHALRGDIHFNDEENWTSGPDKKTGQNFLHTACHELGHSLGLEHSLALDAVMYNRVQKYKPDFALHLDDVNGIQSLYVEEDAASTIKDFDELETAASANYEDFQLPAHARASPNFNVESRNLAPPNSFPVLSHQPTGTSINSHNLYPGAVSNTDPPNRRLLSTSIAQTERKNLEKYCTDYLSSKLIHTNGRSFSCLQFLWNQFYYYRKAIGYELFKINTIPSKAINVG